MRKIFTVLILLLGSLSNAAEFKFAVLGDSQLNNPNTFQNMIHEVDLLKPDFVIQVGDLIHGYTYDEEQTRIEWERFLDQISPLSMPFYPVPGNHDVTTTPMETVYAQVWGAEKFYYSFNHKGSHFVVLDTDYQGHSNTITRDQFEWLGRDLRKNRDADHLFIFMHRPLWRYKKSGWKRLASMLSQYDNVAGVYAGHTHEYCFEETDGLRCFIINSSGHMNYFAPAAGYFFQFLYVSVKGDEASEAIVPAGTIKPHDYVTREERNRAIPYFSPPSGGQIPDPADDPLDVIYSFPLTNRTNEMNVFTVSWELPNPAFSVEPLEQAVLLRGGRTEDVFVRIRAPEQEYQYYSLPYAIIETYHTTLRGESVILRSRHDLCIPRESTARYTASPPWIDGLLDDTAWQSADIFTGFQVDKAGKPAKVQTWVRTLFDEDYFYVGVHCAEPHPENLVAKAAGPVPFIFGDDDVELFLDANHDMKTFARAFVNPEGTTFNSMPGEGLVKEWYDHGEHVGKDYWSVEFRMPFERLGVEDTPTSATIWGFNVRRHDQKPTRVRSDWVKMQNVPYEPWRFGVLHFKP